MNPHLNHATRIRLAIAVGEWASVLGHLDALERADVVTPPEIRSKIQSEFVTFCLLWSGHLADGVDTTAIVEEARAFAAQHQSEIDALLETGVST